MGTGAPQDLKNLKGGGVYGTRKMGSFQGLPLAEK